MREIRTSGSEGGGTGTTGPPYPYHAFAPNGARLHHWAMAGSITRAFPEAFTRSAMDAVGLVAYEPADSGDGYQACKTPPHLELDRILSRVCTGLRNLP
jgi:hypothetical protein